ncbi:MAG: hypothetical protein E7379_02075 [Clostridiales bacterium]|nr:hypothetical protein [Clostridiales bacterium]
MKENVKDFLNACDDLINCKYLVAEYKIQRMLKILANSDEICSLVGECLEQFNRDREFAKAYIQDGNGDFVYICPSEEYKVLALVFCTLVDIDNKKIDFVDFIKRFFGREEVPFQAFLQEMIVPFRNLIADVFGEERLVNEEQATGEESEESIDETDDDSEESEDESEDEDSEEEREDSEDDFEFAQKIAVQILTQLEFSKQDECTENIMQICRAIVKTSSLKDEDVMFGLVYALKHCKNKQVKYLMKELIELFY